MTEPAESPPSARHRAREVALQTLFAMDLQNRPRRLEPKTDALEGEEPKLDAPPPTIAKTSPASASEVFDGVAEHFEMPHAARDFALELVVQVVAHCEGLDEIVSNHAKNWRISRMAIVDRNILRLATFELAHTETAAAIVLNEAVELARRYGSDESPPFVNGVLDAVARKVRSGEFA
ncbi:MAG: transcription antitermination factor NusB [Myxococcales bacterium]|nr:transcription antitermination factor NusB [Myxococcales bacterium]